MDNFLKIQKPNIENGLISIRSNGGLRYFKTSDLVLLNSDLNYTEIHLISGQKIVSSRSLLLFEGALKACRLFIRANRSQLINISHVKELCFSGKNKKIMLTNGSIVEVSRRKFTVVENHLKLKMP
ncbi:MAG: LytTR family DNA-binding domain-containing protein [Spirosomataceae bacterium]|jgi:DNA-binding LytR/AlgR family response regulator